MKSVCVSVAPEKNKPTVAMKKLIEREMRREERGAAQLERMTADTPPPRTPLTPATTVGSPSMQRGGSSMSAIFGRRSVQNFFSGKNSRGASSGGGEASRSFGLPFPFRLPWQQTSSDLSAASSRRSTLRRGESQGDLMTRLANFFLPRGEDTGPPTTLASATKRGDSVVSWIESHREGRIQRAGTRQRNGAQAPSATHMAAQEGSFPRRSPSPVSSPMGVEPSSSSTKKGKRPVVFAGTVDVV